MAVIRCATCGNRFDTDHSVAVPFCSDRCRQIDLGCWLEEKYGLEIEGEESLSEFDRS